MLLADFRALVERLKSEVPGEYQDGIVEIEVSPKSAPHPLRAETFTLGECVPLEWTGTGADLQSRVILYHGSFAALAATAEPGAFDWRQEAWETLTHELRHHIEWRANTRALEVYDWAAEQNFARAEGDEFDPSFYREGERMGPHVYKVDDDVFMEVVPPSRSGVLEVNWHGRRYQATIPEDCRGPAFLTLDGLTDPPPGEAIAVLPRRFTITSLFRRAPVRSETVRVRRLDG